VVRDPVADVLAEGFQRRLDDCCGPGCEGDVVAVQVGEQQSRQAVGAQTDRRCALQHAASAIHQENLSAGPHQGGRPGPIRVGDRTAGTEQRDFDHGFRHVTDPGRLPVN
jgi:hypothetical protein